MDARPPPRLNLIIAKAGKCRLARRAGPAAGKALDRPPMPVVHWRGVSSESRGHAQRWDGQRTACQAPGRAGDGRSGAGRALGRALARHPAPCARPSPSFSPRPIRAGSIPPSFVARSRLSAHWRCAAPKTPSSTSCSRRPREHGRADDRRAVSPRLSRRQPRAGRTRSGDVRRRPALPWMRRARACRPGSASSRASCATGRRSIASGLRRSEAAERYRWLYRPYHAALLTLVEETRARFGVAVVIDCHSMPSAAAVPDVVLGDRYGMCRGAGADARAAAGLRTAGLHRGAQRALCRRLHDAALRPARRAACMRCRSRSTARSIWTKKTSRPGRALTKCARASARRCAHLTALADECCSRPHAPLPWAAE